MSRVENAVARAHALIEQPYRPGGAGARAERWFAVGDPQTSSERFFTFLDRAGVLGRDGMLAPDVGLLSIGDHFDYGMEPERAARDSIANLRWLAEQPAERCVLIAGNHDLCRVAELAFESDESFAAARALGVELLALKESDPDAPRIDEIRREFHARFPRIPTPEAAARDFNGFLTAQRALVQSLLLTRRFALSATARVGAHRAVFVHAGVSERDLSILDLEQERSPEVIARALNRFLGRAVEQVEPAWRLGAAAAIALDPLYVAGTTALEGGGFLYQRPVNPSRPGAGHREHELDGARPRRFDARRLPRGLLQVVGHTAHKKAREELHPWITERAAALHNGGIRTLRVVDGEPLYDLGVHDHVPGAATMIMIDAAMNDPGTVDYPLLPIADVRVPR